jgi:hypothetical protein
MLTSVFALAVLAAPVAAQSEWLAAEGTSVALEFRHPVSISLVDDDTDQSLLNGAYFLSGRFALPVVGIAGVAEIPFAYGKFGSGDTEASGTSIGNIYLGGEMPVMMGLATVTGGVRLPTAPEPEDDNPSSGVGAIAGMTDRFDAFIEKAIVPQLGVRVGIPGIPVVDVEANVNANYVIYGGDDEDDPLVEEEDNDVILDGGVRAFAGLMGARVGVGFEAVAELTGEEDEELGERSFYHAGLMADYSFGMVRPGISFFIPLDKNYKSMFDWMLGLSLEVDLPM